MLCYDFLSVKTDRSFAGIWFRTSTDKIFNACRIPRPVCDEPAEVPPLSLPSARTLLLTVRDWFYILDVVDEHQSPVSPRELECMLHEVVEDVSQRLQQGETAVPISVLSADHRDRWTEVRTQVHKLMKCWV